MVLKVLETHHDCVFSGHQGIKRTLDTIKAKYYWPSLNKDVTEYVTNCRSCNLRKPGKRYTAPMGVFDTVKIPMQLVSMDVVGPLVVSKAGNRYLLSFIDSATRWVEAIAIPDQTAETIAKAFVTNIVARLGVPKYLLTDCGSNFLSKLFREVCRLMKISKLQTTVMHPISNGLCERQHQTIAAMVSHYVNKDNRNWDTFVPYILMALRNAKHPVTKSSPFFLMYGREMRLPADDDYTYSGEKEATVGELAVKIKEANELAAQYTEAARLKNKEYYDKNTRLLELEIGDCVYVYHPDIKKGVQAKFKRYWSGPHEVVGQLTELVYKININGRVVSLHVNRLKKCRDKQLTDNQSRDGRDNATGQAASAHSEISNDVTGVDAPESDGVIPGELNWVDGPILVEDNYIDDVVHGIEPVDFEADESVDEPPDDPRDADWEPEVPPNILPAEQDRDAPAFRTRSRARVI